MLIVYFLQNRDYRDKDYVTDVISFANCDIANSVRTNVAALEQLKDIEILDKYLGLGKLESDLYILANLRKENPEDSLRELAKKFNEKTEKNISKSGINHLFIKLKNKALEYKPK